MCWTSYEPTVLFTFLCSTILRRWSLMPNLKDEYGCCKHEVVKWEAHGLFLEREASLLVAEQWYGCLCAICYTVQLVNHFPPTSAFPCLPRIEFCTTFDVEKRWRPFISLSILDFLDRLTSRDGERKSSHKFVGAEDHQVEVWTTNTQCMHQLSVDYSTLTRSELRSQLIDIVISFLSCSCEI